MEKKVLSRFCVLFAAFCGLCLSVHSLEPASADDADRWSLQDLFQRALSQSEQIRIAEEQLYINRKDTNRAVAVLIPDLTVFGQYMHNDEMTTQLPNASTAYGLKLSQSFTLNGRELVAYKVAKYGIAQAAHDLASVKEGYLFQVAAAYYDVLKYDETKTAAQSDVRRLEAHKKAVLLQLELEIIPKTRLYRTEAELSGAKTRLVQVENQLHTARFNLSRLVDLPENYTLSPPEFSKDVTLNSDELVKTALSYRSDLNALRTEQTIARENIRFSRGGFWPSLSLEGTYTRQEMDPRYYLPVDPETNEIDQDSFSATANLVFPLFEGGLRKSELSQAKAQAKQAELQVAAYEKQVAFEVRKAYRDVITAKSIIQSIQDKVISASKNYDAVSRHFKTGLANSLDVMDANTLLTESEKDLVEARYNYELVIVALKIKSGLLLKSIQNTSATQQPQ